MGAGASTGYDLSSVDKIELTKALEETYQDLKAKDESLNDIELYNALKR